MDINKTLSGSIKLVECYFDYAAQATMGKIVNLYYFYCFKVANIIKNVILLETTIFTEN